MIDQGDRPRLGTGFAWRALIHGCWRALVVTLLLAVPAAPGSASCNQIPGTTNSFRGSRGALNGPFAAPGDLVEVQLVPACDAPAPGISEDAADDVVTVVFTPPHGPRNVVVLAADCNAMGTARRRCAGRPEIANVICITSSLRVQPPDTDVSSSPRLRFRFPDTDAQVDLPADDRTLSGPATIAVSRRSAELPCDLASRSCDTHTDLAACVDTIFSTDGTCGTTPNQTFSHFTALPPPNNYAALCIDPSPPCTGEAAEMRFAVDAAGNLPGPHGLARHPGGASSTDRSPAARKHQHRSVSESRRADTHSEQRLRAFICSGGWSSPPRLRAAGRSDGDARIDPVRLR